MTTITDVAKRAGVSTATVSHVLTGKRTINDEIKQNVLKACRELDYTPNFCASRLSGKKSNIIALLLKEDSLDFEYNQICKELISACVTEAASQGYLILICYEKDKNKLINTVIPGIAPIDGAIILAPCVDDQRFEQIGSKRISCALIGRPNTFKNDLVYVDIDNVGLVKNVTSSLFNAYSSDIYLINSPQEMTISQDRQIGFNEICHTYGIDGYAHTFHAKYCSEAEGYEIAKKIVHKDVAIITANMLLAAGVYQAAKEKQFAIGSEVGVFALGGTSDTNDFCPKLSYAKQDYALLGKNAVDLLIAEIEKKESGKSVLIESQIFYSDSTKK